MSVIQIVPNTFFQRAGGGLVLVFKPTYIGGVNESEALFNMPQQFIDYCSNLSGIPINKIGQHFKLIIE